MEVIDETISSSKSRKRKKTKPSSRKPSSIKRPSSRKPSSIKRPSSRKPSSRKPSSIKRVSSSRTNNLPEFPEFSQINSPLESYDNKNDITSTEMKRKYHDNILPNLTNLLLTIEDDEKYHHDNGDLFSYRLKKQLQHNKFSENDTRYINIIFYKKNLFIQIY